MRRRYVYLLGGWPFFGSLILTGLSYLEGFLEGFNERNSVAFGVFMIIAILALAFWAVYAIIITIIFAVKDSKKQGN